MDSNGIIACLERTEKGLELNAHPLNFNREKEVL